MNAPAVVRALFAAAAVSAAAPSAAADGAPARYDRSSGRVSVEVRSDPAQADSARAFYVEIETAVPSGTSLRMPATEKLPFEGFDVDAAYSASVDGTDGVTRVVHRFRLLPDPSARRFRLAPFAVSAAFPDGVREDFAVPAVVFPKAEIPASAAPPFDFTPKAPRLSFRNEAAAFAAAAVFGLAVAAFAFFPGRLLVRKVREMRKSPVERAYAELDRLAEADLPKHGLYKDFFRELAMVARRYVERAYKIRAPKLTTEEFVQAACASAEFGEESLARLRAILESADLVKFAGARATRDTAEDAVAAVRKYLAEDAIARAARVAAFESAGADAKGGVS